MWPRFAPSIAPPLLINVPLAAVELPKNSIKPPGPPPLKVAPLAINVAVPALAVSRKSVKEPLLPGPSEPLLVKLALAAVELLWKFVPPPPPRTVATPVLLVKLALPALEVSKNCV